MYFSNSDFINPNSKWSFPCAQAVEKKEKDVKGFVVKELYALYVCVYPKVWAFGLLTTV